MLKKSLFEIWSLAYIKAIILEWVEDIYFINNSSYLKWEKPGSLGFYFYRSAIPINRDKVLEPTSWRSRANSRMLQFYFSRYYFLNHFNTFPRFYLSLNLKSLGFWGIHFHIYNFPWSISWSKPLLNGILIFQSFLWIWGNTAIIFILGLRLKYI